MEIINKIIETQKYIIGISFVIGLITGMISMYEILN